MSYNYVHDDGFITSCVKAILQHLLKCEMVTFHANIGCFLSQGEECMCREKERTQTQFLKQGFCMYQTSNRLWVQGGKMHCYFSNKPCRHFNHNNLIVWAVHMQMLSDHRRWFGRSHTDVQMGIAKWRWKGFKEIHIIGGGWTALRDWCMLISDNSGENTMWLSPK